MVCDLQKSILYMYQRILIIKNLDLTTTTEIHMVRDPRKTYFMCIKVISKKHFKLKELDITNP